MIEGKIIDKVTVPTTHSSNQGVSTGIGPSINHFDAKTLHPKFRDRNNIAQYLLKQLTLCLREILLR